MKILKFTMQILEFIDTSAPCGAVIFKYIFLKELESERKKVWFNVSGDFNSFANSFRAHVCGFYLL